MNKQIEWIRENVSTSGVVIDLFIILFVIGLINSASAMYAGDSMTFEVDFTNPVYTVVGNESSIEGLNVTFENGNITISPALNYKPDNFTIIFFDNITNEVIKTIHTRGRTRTEVEYVDNNVTVYIPEYINTTEIVEVEKIVDNTTVLETGYEAWHIIVGIALGILLGGIVFGNISRKKEEVEVEESDTAEEIVAAVED